MRGHARYLSLILVLAILPGAELFGCGDKYLSVGRGTRFQRGYVSLRPLSVVVLASEVTSRKDFLSRLRVAGHKIEIANDAFALEKSLASGKHQLVLANYSDAAKVESLLKAMPNKPLFLPVVDPSQKPALAAVNKEYGCLLNAESKKKKRTFLAVIDEAVEANLKAKPVVCDITEM